MQAIAARDEAKLSLAMFPFSEVRAKRELENHHVRTCTQTNSAFALRMSTSIIQFVSAGESTIPTQIPSEKSTTKLLQV